MNNIVVLLAQEGGLGGFTGLFPILMIIFIFYMLLYRPESKRRKQHQVFLTELKKGDEVVTQGGLLGRVMQIDGPKVVLDVGDGNSKVKVQVLKSQISGSMKDTLKAQEIEKPKEGKPVSSNTKAAK